MSFVVLFMVIFCCVRWSCVILLVVLNSMSVVGWFVFIFLCNPSIMMLSLFMLCSCVSFCLMVSSVVFSVCGLYAILFMQSHGRVSGVSVMCMYGFCP